MSNRSRPLLVNLPARAALLCAIIVMALGAGLVAQTARGDDAAFRVIVNPETAETSVSRELLADVFLKTTTRWPDGESARPVDQRPDTAARKAFTDGILKRTVGAVRNYWQQRIFSGRDVPPPELDSDEAVVKYVSEHRGAVGYVSATAKTGGAKVVAVK